MHCQSVVSEANTRTMSECLYAGGHVWGHLWVASVPSECRCPRRWCHHCLSGTCLRDSGWEPSESGLCDHGSDSCIVSRHVPLPCRLPRQLFLLRGTFPGVPSWTSTAFPPSISAEDGKAPSVVHASASFCCSCRYSVTLLLLCSALEPSCLVSHSRAPFWPTSTASVYYSTFLFITEGIIEYGLA